MKPVLFLDVDGVLNEFGSQPEGGMLGLQSDKVARLKRALYNADCDVVLSSTWRIIGRNIAKVEAMLQEMCVAPLYDVTPRAKMGQHRGDEIRAWLTKHPERSRFVVLDDDVLPDEFPDENQVHTDGYDGALTEEKADEVIMKLRAQCEKEPRT